MAKETAGGRPLLEGVRVLDFSMIWDGPYATRLLVDLGAEVIKVEAVQRIDSLRHLPYFPGGKPGADPWNCGALFHDLGRNKLGLTLDLGRPQGKEHLLTLARISDVVVENFSAGVMASLGIDYPVLREVRPDVIMCSMPGYGRTGPYRDFRAMGLSMDAISGLAWATGYPGGPPMRQGVSYGDPIAGVTGAFAILTALEHRAVTGQGQHIDLSQAEAITSLLPDTIMDYAMNQRNGAREGNAHSWMAPHGCYRTRGEDQWITIVVTNDEQWDALCRVMGNPVWSKEERFRAQIGRWDHREDLNRYMEAWSSEQDAAEIFHQLEQAGVSAGPVLTAKGLVEDQHLNARGFFTTVRHPEAGEFLLRMPPWKLSAAPQPALGLAPFVGEHRLWALKEVLGLSSEEVEAMEQDKITGATPVLGPS